MKALLTLTALCSLLTATTAAHADANVPLKPPKVYTGIHPPSGTKPSSFAPQPGNKRHVYGAPIQGRIFKMQPKKPATVANVPPAPKKR